MSLCGWRDRTGLGETPQIFKTLPLSVQPMRRAIRHHLGMSICPLPPSTARHCDVIIVGAGPTGSLITHRLAAKGLSVLVIEAGQRFGGHHTLPNPEANAGRIMWSEPRNHVGSDFVVRNSLVRSATAVGGIGRMD